MTVKVEDKKPGFKILFRSLKEILANPIISLLNLFLSSSFTQNISDIFGIYKALRFGKKYSRLWRNHPFKFFAIFYTGVQN